MEFLFVAFSHEIVGWGILGLIMMFILIILIYYLFLGISLLIKRCGSFFKHSVAYEYQGHGRGRSVTRSSRTREGK